LLLAAVARNSLAPHLKSPFWMALQPVAALLLLAAIFSDSFAQSRSARPLPKLQKSPGAA
jgi:hypothetical protein